VDYEKLGLRVRQQRELNGLTQSQLARKVGITGSFIGHIERGEKKASVDTVVALCNALEISPTLLLQDSLSDEAMQSQLSFDEDSQDLMRGIMRVLREHTRRVEYR
jgi:transcriptional regulator with XRE-family HTH domain